MQLELKIPPLALGAAFACAIVALGHWMPAANLPFAGHRTASIALALIGAAVATAGVLQFRRAKTSVNPLDPDRAGTVVASGVYGLSRNPMYLGMALVLLGVAAWHATLIGLVLVPLFCLYITAFQIKPEERVLLARFGQAFASYQIKVRRWI
jgi:protein-S-isoprenylcysteine O-methyltransferase Ste14